ncbi:MAPEG family protein [uncultured Erythrobacter sp.]|uniref:MAPEG family protein n=1 Tax=uncultured Erythrobacter sp. TaxID=263913 RepID=UPI00265A8E71|nr:MAPEG family protein [uncultured Erythrobacter sp.]
MIGMDILQPVVVLLAWTMVMWVWMYVTRIPAMLKAGIDAKGMVGSTGASLRAQLPDSVSWKADNYNHLHEAPTLFYAVAIVLAIIGQGDGPNTKVAWAYVGLRIAHSIVQVTVNRVAVRFALFALSSIALMVLIFHAIIPVFDLHLHG